MTHAARMSLLGPRRPLLMEDEVKSPPAFQAYARDWLGDPEVSSCSPATRGIWWDAICAMHEAGRTGVLTGTVEELARICRCIPAEMEDALAELKRSQTANVTLRNGRVTLVNRRMSREHKSRDSGRIRQERHRQSRSGNADVTSPLQSSTSTSTSQKEKKAPAVADLLDGYQIPGELDCPHFQIAAEEWIAYRRKRRLPKYVSSRWLTELVPLGIHGAIEAIDHSMDKEYQGIYPPNDKRDHPRPQGYAPPKFEQPESSADHQLQHFKMIATERLGKEHHEAVDLCDSPAVVVIVADKATGKTWEQFLELPILEASDE